MVNVVVAQKKTIKVSTGAPSNVISTNTPVTLKNNPPLSVIENTTELAQLTDVILVNETDGATLVYNANTRTFDVEPFDLSHAIGGLNDIDGGVF
jgi:hypothetical protein